MSEPSHSCGALAMTAEERRRQRADALERAQVLQQVEEAFSD